MSDTARLILSVDSSQTKTAATNLDAMTNAANRAATSTDRLTKQSGLARHELVNLSRQVQDIGVSLVSGQSPFTVLVQQGTQVADIFGNSQGTIRGFGSQIASVITPVRLLSAGVLGLGAGFAYALKSVADSAKQFDDVSRAAGTTMGVLRGLQQAASFKGIGQEEFLKTIQQRGGQIYSAKNNMGQLADFLRANGQSAKTLQDAFEKVADLIKNARDDQERLQLLQRAGLPATMDWVRFLSQGKDGIRAATAEAVKFNESAEGKLIESARKFDEAWNKTWSNWTNGIKSALLTGLNGLDDFTLSALAKFKVIAAGTYGKGSGLSLAGGSQLSTTDAGKFYDAVGISGGARGPRPVNDEVMRALMAREQPLLTLFGQLKPAQPKPKPEEKDDRDHPRKAA